MNNSKNKEMMSRFTLMALTTGLCLGVGGCSIFGGGSKVQKDVVLPSDREEIRKQVSQKEYTSESIIRGEVSGDWAIEEVCGKPVVGQTPPYLKFVPSEKRVYGNNGCNTINAGYSYNAADSTLSFSNVISTMMMCNVEGITDIEINAAISNVKYYTWENKGDEYYLYLWDTYHQPMLTLMHQNFEFLNGTWRVVSIEDEAVSDPEVKLVIDVAEGKVHGNTGCNVLNGSLDLYMENPNSISFQDLITTRMACPNPEYETRLLVALESTERAKPISSDRVLLLNGAGDVVLTLQRVTEGID